MIHVSEIDLKKTTALELFLGIPKTAEKVAFLCSDGSTDARYSILTANPIGSIRYDGKTVFVDNQAVEDSLNDVISHVLKERQTDQSSDLPFIGGLIGALEYEFGYAGLDLPNRFSSEHMVEWQVYDHALIYDHQQERWHEVRKGNEDRLHWQEWLEQTPRSSDQDLSLAPSWNKQEYVKRFEQLKENIRIGEIYQACLTFPFTGKTTSDPRSLFAQLLQENPAPMAAYLDQGDRQILSLSPERFIRWDGKVLETKPIKGTRPRGKTKAEDEELKNDLLKNEKEMAELNMITDLLRNDLAKVSQPGSVKVIEHQTLLECPQVWHAYSYIRSQSKEGLNAWAILSSMFPGGSISGCPKRRAVELLSQMESEPRGIYTGCIGYISDHGKMDMNIAIRTLENSRTGIRAGFGGGIVFDSKADQEYQECFAKARTFGV